MEPLELRAVPATLSGTAFLDSNSNGVQDAGEDGVAGVVVTASPAAGGQLTGTTDATGHYQIDGIPYGSCSDSIAAPAGYTVSSTSETTYPGFYVTDPDTDAFTLDIGLSGGPFLPISFTLSDGITGALSYDLPWDSIDPDQESQSLPLANFSLTLAGQMLTESRSDVSFTTSPTARFAYGELTGITFGIDTSAIPGFAYSSVSASGLVQLTAVPTGTTDTVTGTLDPISYAKLNFAGVTTGKAYDVEVQLEAGNQPYNFFVSITASATASDVRDAVELQLTQIGFKVQEKGTAGLVILGKGTDQLESVTITFGKPQDTEGGHEKPDNTLVGPTLDTFWGVQVQYNGTNLNPQ